MSVGAKWRHAPLASGKLRVSATWTKLVRSRGVAGPVGEREAEVRLGRINVAD
jgi:hypothetical protein